jgi:acid phosphatase
VGISESAGFVFPPSLRYLGPDRAVIFFELVSAADGVLVLNGPDGERTLPFEANSPRHLFEARALFPAASYRARVGLPTGTGYQEPYYDVPGAGWTLDFNTLPESPPYRAAVIGDAGFGDSTTYALVELLAADPDLDFVIHTGDVVYQIYNNRDAFDAYDEKWFRPFAPLLRRMPVYTVPGNHDHEPAARQETGESFYYHAFPPYELGLGEEPLNQFYAVPLGDIQLLFLDSQTFFGQPGEAAQEAWLGERLADPTFQAHIPVFHVPAYSSGRHGDADSWPVRRGWGPLFAGSAVPLALSGHDHNYERLIVGGTTYVVSGGGSASLYTINVELPESQLFASRSHVVLLDIYPDRVELKAVGRDGEVFDRATIPLPGS